MGHMRMIQAGLSTCEHLLVLVGSSQESMTLRNPFNLKTRMDLLRIVFKEEIHEGRLLLGHIDDMTNENDHCVEWGDFVLKKVDMWRQHYGIDHKMDCMIYGNDEERFSWYKPEAVSHVSQIILSREEISISATEMREALIDGHWNKWRLNVPTQLAYMTHFDLLRDELLNIPVYKEMLENGEN
jgi:nicotinamide-nucleotide adenylyltransferase